MCDLLLNSFQYMCLKKNYLQEIEKKYLYTITCNGEKPTLSDNSKFEFDYICSKF